MEAPTGVGLTGNHFGTHGSDPALGPGGRRASQHPMVPGPTLGWAIMGEARGAGSTDIVMLRPGAASDGRYSVVSTLGIGGTSAVCQTIDTPFNLIAARDTPRLEISDDPWMVGRLREEGVLAQGLNHLNLLTLRHLDIHVPLVFMEWMGGGDLWENLASEDGPLTSTDALPFIRCMRAGLRPSAQHRRTRAQSPISGLGRIVHTFETARPGWCQGRGLRATLRGPRLHRYALGASERREGATSSRFSVELCRVHELKPGPLHVRRVEPALRPGVRPMVCGPVRTTLCRIRL